MALVSTPHNRVIADTDGLLLSGYLYRDDNWLESVARRCFVYLPEYSDINQSRSSLEALAGQVVAAGFYFYIGYSYSQNTSDNLPSYRAVNMSILSRVATSLTAMSTHLTYLDTTHGLKFPEVDTYTLISRRGTAISLLDLGPLMDKVSNHVIMNVGVQDVTNSYNSFYVQSLNSAKVKTLLLFNPALHEKALKLRYQLADNKKLMFIGASANVDISNSSNWLNLVIAHSTAEENVEVADGDGTIVYTPGL